MNKLPSGWQVKSLSDVVRISKGKKLNSLVDNITSTSNRFIQIDDLRNNDNIKITEDNTGVLVTEKDVLIAWDGANAGTVGFGLNGYIGSTIARLEIIRENVSTNYLGWFLRTKSIHLRDNSTGATIPHLSRVALESLKIPLPPHPIQKQIAEILVKADQAKQKRQEANKLSEQFLQSAFVEMFGDPVKNPKKWMTKSISAILKNPLQSGAYYSKELYVDRQNAIGTKMIHMADAFYGNVETNNLRKVLIKKSEIDKYKIQSGDILIARRSLTYEGSAKACLLNDIKENIVYESSLIRLRTDNELINPVYLYYFLSNEHARKKYVLKYVTSSTISGINQSNLGRVEVLVPPITFQQQFAELVQKTETLKEKQKESEVELENLFNSLMQKAFKGELIFSEEKLKLTTTDLHAGILTKIISIHSLNPKYESTLGHVKAEKICHVIESYLELDLGRNPVRIAAGPADFKHLKKVEHRARMKNWFSVSKREHEIGYRYSLEKSSQFILNDISDLFGSREDELDRIINLFLHQDTHRAEVVTTVFAAWNDLLLEGKEARAKDIVCEAREKWTKNKLLIEEEKFYKSVEWLQKNNLVPKGKGKHTISTGELIS